MSNAFARTRRLEPLLATTASTGRLRLTLCFFVSRSFLAGRFFDRRLSGYWATASPRIAVRSQTYSSSARLFRAFHSATDSRRPRKIGRRTSGVGDQRCAFSVLRSSSSSLFDTQLISSPLGRAGSLILVKCKRQGTERTVLWQATALRSRFGRNLRAYVAARSRGKPALIDTPEPDHGLDADHAQQGRTEREPPRLVQAGRAPSRSSCQPPTPILRQHENPPAPSMTEARPPAVRRPSEMDRAQVCHFRSRPGRRSGRNDPSGCARSGDARRSFEMTRWRLHAAA